MKYLKINKRYEFTAILGSGVYEFSHKTFNKIYPSKAVNFNGNFPNK